jgi:hypothetical protein
VQIACPEQLARIARCSPVRSPLLCVALAGCGRPDAIASAPAPVALPREASPPADPCPAEQHAFPAGITATRTSLDATAATGGPACVDLVHVDLARFRLRVLSAARDGGAHPAPAWRETFHLTAVINAGMFHDDGTPVGMVIQDGKPLAPDNPKYPGILAFDPRSPTDPPALITGRDCAGFDLTALRRRYRSLVQAPRLLGCDGAALAWQDPKRYSAAAIGVARDGTLVLVHARAAVTMSELATALAHHDLAGALFLEGGPEASLLVDGDPPLSRVGSYETGFVENDGNQSFWWLPNVLGIAPR